MAITGFQTEHGQMLMLCFAEEVLEPTKTVYILGGTLIAVTKSAGISWIFSWLPQEYCKSKGLPVLAAQRRPVGTMGNSSVSSSEVL